MLHKDKNVEGCDPTAAGQAATKMIRIVVAGNIKILSKQNNAVSTCT